MKTNTFYAAILGLCFGYALQACTPSGQCLSNSDCAEGDICNARGECSAAYVPPPRDASYHDLCFLDHRQEDRAQIDSGLDAGQRDTQPGDAPVDAGVSQVDWFTTCSAPAALALSDDGRELFVSCVSGDQIQVYNPLSGQSLRVLNQLSSPCAASALLLRQDYNQLWVSCGATQNQAVLCVSPDTGLQIQNPIKNSRSSPHANFASGGDLIAWVNVGGNDFSIQQLSNSGSSVLLDDLVFGGSDVAINASGNRIFLLQINSQTNTIRRYDDQAGLLNDINAIIAQPRFIAAAKVNSAALDRPLLIANNLQFLRIPEEGGSVGSVENVNEGIITSVVSKADGSAFFLAASDITQGSSWIYQISSDPLVSTALLSKQQVPACQISALAAAADGRVFAACSDTDRVYVKTF